jgi:hypothetical protein
LVEIQGAVLAVDDAGTLVLWDLREVRKVQGVYIFKDNISLLPSKGSLKIDPHSLQGLKQFQNTLVMYVLPHSGTTRRPSTSPRSSTSSRVSARRGRRT